MTTKIKAILGNINHNVTALSVQFINVPKVELFKPKNEVSTSAKINDFFMANLITSASYFLADLVEDEIIPNDKGYTIFLDRRQEQSYDNILEDFKSLGKNLAKIFDGVKSSFENIAKTEFSAYQIESDKYLVDLNFCRLVFSYVCEVMPYISAQHRMYTDIKCWELFNKIVDVCTSTLVKRHSKVSNFKLKPKDHSKLFKSMKTWELEDFNDFLMKWETRY